MMGIETRERIPKATIRSERYRKFGTAGRHLLRDKHYLKYSFTELMEAVKLSDVIKREYVIDFYDCDDKADALDADIRWKCIGIPFGTVMFWYPQRGKWQGHLMCAFYDSDSKRFKFVEPEDGSVRRWQKGWKLSELRF